MAATLRVLLIRRRYTSPALNGATTSCRPSHFARSKRYPDDSDSVAVSGAGQSQITAKSESKEVSRAEESAMAGDSVERNLRPDRASRIAGTRSFSRWDFMTYPNAPSAMQRRTNCACS